MINLSPFLLSFFFFFSFFFLFQDREAGVVAAAFVAIVPGLIPRTTAGAFDNEAVGIFAMLLTFYLWLRACKTGQLMWAAGCALALFFLVGPQRRTRRQEDKKKRKNEE